ncbi:OB-fold domain-containing protein [Blastomonas sp. UPD001]|jgi:uncharacterized OB-fold protein|uniref:Zn-ribbon domain-containing OB-fold protein n=1 Tax=Blastomonas sp. UPD001 TaxID=2217673 RepID=UPI000E340875
MSAFQKALELGRIDLPCCNGCGRFHAPARLACPHCGATALQNRELRTTGTVLATTRVYRAPDEYHRSLVPYTLVLVAMDDDVILMGHTPEDAAIGDRLAAAPSGSQGAWHVQFRSLNDD